MSISTQDYALLSKDSYNGWPKDKDVTLSGIEYKVYDTFNDPVTGYHGTAYQRKDTNEIVITHRGTEPNLEGGIQDGLTDLGMVATGGNAQVFDARYFTNRVLAQVAKDNPDPAHRPTVTLTGHSLGGALAEITAHEFHLRGETFNGYGAVNLQHDIPEGGHQVINHVRATDVVSAASHHFGSVRVYATAQDIADMQAGGYDDKVTASSLRNPLKPLSFDAHSITNFAPDDPSLTPSDLSPENDARARAHGQAIHLWREDVQSLRSNTLSKAWETAHKVGTARDMLSSAGRSVLHGDFHQAGQTLEQVGHRTVDNLKHQRDTVLHTAALAGEAAAHVGHKVAHAASEAYDDARDAMKRSAHELAEGAQMAKQQAKLVGRVMGEGLSDMAHTLSHPGSWFDHKSAAPAPAASLDHPSHPGNTMYRQCLDGVTKLNAQHDVAPSARDANFAGALAVKAAAHGLSRVDHVLLSDDASRAFAVQGQLGGWDKRLASVETVAALHTPLATSSAQWEAAQRQAEEQAHTRTQAQQAMQPPLSPALGR